MNSLMRILVMFDLPVGTKKERGEATRFRNFLLKDGYFMMQFSVYGRICNGTENVNKHLARLEKNLPADGSVRVLTITERQCERMKILVGEKTIPDVFEQMAFTLDF